MRSFGNSLKKRDNYSSEIWYIVCFQLKHKASQPHPAMEMKATPSEQSMETLTGWPGRHEAGLWRGMERSSVACPLATWET